jgi:hypothetical protein
MFDRHQSRPGSRHHINLLGLELANDHAAAILDSFFQVFQQQNSMSDVVSYDSAIRNVIFTGAQIMRRHSNLPDAPKRHDLIEEL